MSQRITLASFGHERDVLQATAALRRHGYPIIDVYSPHAIHGIDEAMGLKPSRLTWVCFICGAIGALGMFWFQHWTNAVQWPLNVGGKPWNSIPAETPVAFEMLVLLAAFGSVFACLFVCRLFPWRDANPNFDGVTDDRYMIAVGELGQRGTAAELKHILEQFDLLEIKEPLS